jgi:hypothetical protein
MKVVLSILNLRAKENYEFTGNFSSFLGKIRIIRGTFEVLRANIPTTIVVPINLVSKSMLFFTVKVLYQSKALPPHSSAEQNLQSLHILFPEAKKARQSSARLFAFLYPAPVGRIKPNPSRPSN